MPKTSTSFKPGNNANPNGRPPKEWTMTALYKEAGEEADETGEKKNKIVARKLWQLAARGDVMAIKELGNRIDGMPKQKLEHTGEDGNAIRVVVEDYADNSNTPTETKDSS